MNHSTVTRQIALAALFCMSSLAHSAENGATSGSSGTPSQGQGTGSEGRGVSQLVERPSTSGSGSVKTATSGAPGVNNLPTAEGQPQSSGASGTNPSVMPEGTSGGPGVQGAPHVGIPGTGSTNQQDKVNSWGEKVIEK